ncbi:MAG: hypothetical protein SPJ13_01505 [Bacteroidales bacterium]|nr:hypothetical protein [Bacteroidales bacterium]
MDNNTTKPYLDRMIDEEKQLGERIEKLRVFILKNDLFHSLSQQKKNLMKGQLHAMMLYQHFLRERINLEDSNALAESYNNA